MRIALDESAYMPTRAHHTDAGYDLRSPMDAVLKAGKSLVIDTGVHIELPRGKCALLVSNNVLNVFFDATSTGLINEGYTGPIVVNLQNYGNQDIVINRGNKISRFVILDYSAEPLVRVGVNEL